MLQFWTGVSGQYYFMEDEQWSGAGFAAPLNALIPFPVVLNSEQAFDRMAVPINTGGAAGSVIRLGIYNDSNGIPGSLILDTGTIATTAAALSVDANGNSYVQTTISQTLSGPLWLALVAQVAAPGVYFTTTRSNRAGDSQPGTTSPTAQCKTGVGGALPDPFGSFNGTSANGYPMILLRAA